MKTMAPERRVLLWMCVLIAVNQLGFGAVVPTLPLYAQSFGVTVSAIGLAVAVYGLARFVLAAPSGHLADRIGRRPTLALGGLLSAAGNIWCALAAGYPEFILARFAAGAGAGIVLTCGQIVLADISTPAVRGRMIAAYQGTFIFAVGIGPFPGGLLAAEWGLAAPFWACGLASFLASAVAWFAVGETRAMARTGAGSGVLPGFFGQMRLLVRQIGFVLVSAIAFMNAVTRTGGLFAIIPLLGSARLGLSVTQIGFAMMLGSVIGLAATWPAGVVLDRFGRKTVIVPVTLLTGLSFLLFAWAPSYAWFAGGCVLWGVASAVGGAAPAAYAADSAAPGMNAAAMSGFRMIGDLGYVVGPIILGFIADVRGPDAALVTSAVLLTGTALLFARLAPETWHGPGRARPKV